MAESPSQDARFNQLFIRHRDAVWAYCYRRLRPDEVPDAVAEVFLVMWRKLNGVPGGDQTLPWLYGVARNVTRNFHRSTMRRMRLHRRLESLRDVDQTTPEVHVVGLAGDRKLMEAVSSLGPLETELLRLRTWEELSLKEIAQATGMSERAVESRLARIRHKLSVKLSHPNPRHGWLSPARREGGEQ